MVSVQPMYWVTEIETVTYVKKKKNLSISLCISFLLVFQIFFLQISIAKCSFSLFFCSLSRESLKNNLPTFSRQGLGRYTLSSLDPTCEITLSLCCTMINCSIGIRRMLYRCTYIHTTNTPSIVELGHKKCESEKSLCSNGVPIKVRNYLTHWTTV